MNKAANIILTQLCEMKTNLQDIGLGDWDSTKEFAKSKKDLNQIKVELDQKEKDCVEIMAEYAREGNDWISRDRLKEIYKEKKGGNLGPKFFETFEFCYKSKQYSKAYSTRFGTRSTSGGKSREAYTKVTAPGYNLDWLAGSTGSAAVKKAEEAIKNAMILNYRAQFRAVWGL